MRKCFFVLAFGLSTGVFAEPVYLNCMVSSDKESKKFHVKLDEVSGKITHTGEGGAFNADGFFAANSIRYQNISISSGIEVKFAYEIDRSTLEVTEAFETRVTDPKFANKIPGSQILMKGSCEIEEVKDRII